jgi:hypothetical protein
MSAQVGRIVGYRNDMAGPPSDIAVAAGAEVHLRGLEWLHEPHIARIVVPEVHVQPNKAQATRSATTMRPAATYQ